MSNQTQETGEITISGVSPECAVLIQELVRRALRVNDFIGCEVHYHPPVIDSDAETAPARNHSGLDETYLDLTNAVAEMLQDPKVLRLFDHRWSGKYHYMWPGQTWETAPLGSLLRNRLLRLREFLSSTSHNGKLDAMSRRLLALGVDAKVYLGIEKPIYTVDLGQLPKITPTAVPYSEHIARPDFVDAQGNVTHWLSIEINAKSGVMVF
jgi:hypothetical protein